VLGILRLDSDAPGQFSDADAQRLQILATAAAIAIRNARLYEAAQEEIAERKQAEAALRKSEKRHKDAERAAHLGSWEMDITTGDAVWSDEFFRICGYEPGSIEPTSEIGFQIIHPDDRDRAAEAVNEAIETGKPYEIEKRIVRPDGTVRWVHSIGEITYDCQGQPKTLLGSFQDITERIQMESDLRERESRFRGIVETAPFGYYLVDKDGLWEYVNPAWEKMHSLRLEDVAGKSFEITQPVEALEDARENVRRALSGETLEGEFSRVSADGQVGHHTFSIQPVEVDGEITGIEGFINDITQRKQMEEQLRQQERLAAVGQLAGGIAHDFNNLLASIILNAQMPLRQPDLTSRTQDALKTIIEESHRAADLVQQILDFSRRAMLDVEPVDLVTLVHQAVTLLRRTIPEHIHITTEMQSPSCTIKADATRIHQVLTNLALNARDAMPQGGDLHIQVKRVTVTEHDTPTLPEMPSGSWACMTISDTGTGMTEEAQSHLFEPFFTTKEQGKGTGLGLAQVYGIVKQHKGFIGVDTAVGEGTTFTIYLPLAEKTEEQEEVSEREGRPSHGEGETILVIEDSKPLRTAIKSGLESLDYHVVTAINGQEALQISLQGVDLVLTDMVMPKMNGDVLLKELRRQAPQLKVIAMTGHVLDIDVEDLKADGFTNAILKPFSIQDLTAVVRDALDDNARGP
jgi:PAS domain S-box-containing protein